MTKVTSFIIQTFDYLFKSFHGALNFIPSTKLHTQVSTKHNQLNLQPLTTSSNMAIKYIQNTKHSINRQFWNVRAPYGIICEPILTNVVLSHRKVYADCNRHNLMLALTTRCPNLIHPTLLPSSGYIRTKFRALQLNSRHFYSNLFLPELFLISENPSQGSSFIPNAPKEEKHNTKSKITSDEISIDTKFSLEPTKKADDNSLRPKEIVKYLDKYIIGQTDAKKAVANALRQRWRRQNLGDNELKDDITPKNILMVGPTGVGKTEIARKLSHLVDAPFIKVEATKFTEVGFHGRDVEQIVKDLVEISVKKQQSKLEKEYHPLAEKLAEERILEALLGKLTDEDRNKWIQHLRAGLLDDRVINVEVPVPQQQNTLNSDPIQSAIREAISQQNHIKGAKLFSSATNKHAERRSMSVKEARQRLIQSELESNINQEMIYSRAITSVEQEGIVFIDEIDKICTKQQGGYSGPDASAEGVQRDLLPLIEGTTVSTRYGNAKTDYILFIVSGAFHNVKPSDMLAELQGRLPVKVELDHLYEADFIRILKEPKNSLIEQSEGLLRTEGVELLFTDDAITELARVSHEINQNLENIGARRLHTIIERVLSDLNFEAPDMDDGTCVTIDSQYVKRQLDHFLKKTDLSKYIL